jgi:hypothetical protein
MGDETHRPLKMFSCVNQTRSVEDDWARFGSKDFGKGVREEALIVQHRSTTQMFGGYGHPSSAALASRINWLACM